MSVQVEESGGGGGGGGGILRQKMGPWPVWLYLVLVTAAGLAYYLYERHKNGSSSSASTSTTGTASTGQMTGSANVPDYVFQNTTNVTEPPDQVNITPPPPPAPTPPVTTTPPPKTVPPPGKTTKPPTKPVDKEPVMSNTYTVKAGDTLNSLAKKFGISRVELAHDNGLGTGAGLKTGQKLKVPGPVRPRPGGPG